MRPVASEMTIASGTESSSFENWLSVAETTGGRAGLFCRARLTWGFSVVMACSVEQQNYEIIERADTCIGGLSEKYCYEWYIGQQIKGSAYSLPVHYQLTNGQP